MSSGALPEGIAPLQIAPQEWKERLLNRQHEVINATTLQFAGEGLLVQPAAAARGYEFAARFRFLRAEQAAARPTAFRGIPQLQRYAVVFLCEDPQRRQR